MIKMKALTSFKGVEGHMHRGMEFPVATEGRARHLEVHKMAVRIAGQVTPPEVKTGEQPVPLEPRPGGARGGVGQFSSSDAGLPQRQKQGTSVPPSPAKKAAKKAPAKKAARKSTRRS